MRTRQDICTTLNHIKWILKFHVTMRDQIIVIIAANLWICSCSMIMFLGNSKILAKLDYQKNWQKRDGKSTTTTSNPSMHKQQNTMIQFWPSATFSFVVLRISAFLTPNNLVRCQLAVFGEKKAASNNIGKRFLRYQIPSFSWWEERKSRKARDFGSAWVQQKVSTFS